MSHKCQHLLLITICDDEEVSYHAVIVDGPQFTEEKDVKSVSGQAASR